MSDKEEKPPSEDAQILGPFVIKGMRLKIKDFPISMGDDGQLILGPLTLYTNLDMSSYWLKIAYIHLLATEQAHKALLDAKQRNHDEDTGSALEQEFLSGMQAITAAGVAVDAFYSRVKEDIEIPDEVTRAWREKKTARYKQIAETFKIAFGLRNEVVLSLREVLKQNFDARDKAGHPSSKTAALTLHPELNQVTDWRFEYFRFHNSKITVKIAFQVIYQIATLTEKNRFASSKLGSGASRTAKLRDGHSKRGMLSLRQRESEEERPRA